MPADFLPRITDFLLSFARRQADEVREVPGGFAVLDRRYAASYDNNRIVVTRVLDPAGLLSLSEAVLGHLPHRRITVLDDAAGTACAPVMEAAGYSHDTEVVMAHSAPGPAPAPGGPPARPVPLEDLRPAALRQLRAWMPDADGSVVRALADRRAARLRGAGLVEFLGVRDEDGTVVSWADLYLDRAGGTAQVEELVTADPHTRRGHADTVLATALHRARSAGCDLFFLLADPGDRPHTWYARRGFTPVGTLHVFTRA